MNPSCTLLKRMVAGFGLALAIALSFSASAAAPCTSGKPCYNAGPFSAEIVNLITARKAYGNQGQYVTLRFYMQLTNHTTQPIWIGYRSQSSVLIDDQANRYDSKDDGVKGIGLTSQHGLDPQLLLQPGEARTVTFESMEYFANDQIFGTIYNYDLTFDQLEVTPSQQARKLREYNMSFHNVAASTFAPAPSTNVANAPSASSGPQYQLLNPQQQVAQQPQQPVQQPAVAPPQPAAYQQQQPVYQQPQQQPQQPVYQQAPQQPVYQQAQQPVYQQAQQPVYQQQQPQAQQAVYQQPPQQAYPQQGYPQQQVYNQQGQPVDPNAKPDKMQKVNEGVETAKKIMGLFGGSKE